MHKAYIKVFSMGDPEKEDMKTSIRKMTAFLALIKIQVLRSCCSIPWSIALKPIKLKRLVRDRSCVTPGSDSAT